MFGNTLKNTIPENEIHRLIDRKENLVETLRKKNLIKITTEIANRDGD